MEQAPVPTERKKKPLVLALLALTLFIGVGLFFALKQKPGSDPSQSTTPQTADSTDPTGTTPKGQPPSQSKQTIITGTAQDNAGETTTAATSQTKPSLGDRIGQMFSETFGLGKKDAGEEAAELVERPETTEGEKTAMTEAPQAPEEGCFEATYQHRKLASHADGEACTQHANAIKLEVRNPDRLNSKSVCVRVNGRPVRHQLRKDTKTQLVEVIFDSVAGVNSKVTARYCMGSAGCNEDCTVKKDEFLEAIGADAGNEDDAALPTVHWNTKDPKRKLAKEETDLDTEIVELGKVVAKASGSLSGADGKKSTFKEWTGSARVPACSPKSAQNTGSGEKNG